MSRFQKVLLPPDHPLVRAASNERQQKLRALGDPRVKVALGMADQVTDMLGTGGEIQLLDKEGKLQTVRIKGLLEE